MEHLTKSQIVLLTLFTSFVSSLATGIVVVTLMQQAPEPVLQSITNVVEKSIERIVPTIVEKPGKTVVVKDEDLMVSAIERNNKSVVSFRSIGEDGEVRLAGVGTIVSAEGLVVTDRANFNSGNLTTTVDGIKYSLEIIANGKDGSLGLAKLVPADSDKNTKPAVFTPATLGDANALKVGQTAIVISGREGKSIITGLVAGLDMQTIVNKDTKTETKILKNIDLSQKLNLSSNGAPIISLNGLVVGFVSIDGGIGIQGGVPAAEAKTLISGASKSSEIKAVGTIDNKK